MDEPRRSEGEDLIARLADRLAITDLLHRYCRYVDLYRPADIASLFTSDCVVSYGPTLGSARGPAEVESSLRAGLARYTATSHHLSNVQIEFTDPDRATGVSYVYAWHRLRSGKPDAHLWGQYHDVFVRTDQGWRIKQRTLKVAGQEAFDVGWEMIGREEPDLQH